MKRGSKLGKIAATKEPTRLGEAERLSRSPFGSHKVDQQNQQLSNEATDDIINEECMKE